MNVKKKNAEDSALQRHKAFAQSLYESGRGLDEDELRRWLEELETELKSLKKKKGTGNT